MGGSKCSVLGVAGTATWYSHRRGVRLRELSVSGGSIVQRPLSDATKIAAHLQYFLLGNLLGPVVNTTIEGGLEKFFRQPTGCGEQNMIYLAPNVYVLEYLMNTNQLTGANEENAYRFIQSGMPRDMA